MNRNVLNHPRKNRTLRNLPHCLRVEGSGLRERSWRASARDELVRQPEVLMHDPQVRILVSDRSRYCSHANGENLIGNNAEADNSHLKLVSCFLIRSNHNQTALTNHSDRLRDVGQVLIDDSSSTSERSER